MVIRLSTSPSCVRVHHRKQGEQLKAVHHASKEKMSVTKHHKHSIFEPQPDTSQVEAIHKFQYGKKHAYLCRTAFQRVRLYNLFKIWVRACIFSLEVAHGCTISIYMFERSMMMRMMMMMMMVMMMMMMMMMMSNIFV